MEKYDVTVTFHEAVVSAMKVMGEDGGEGEKRAFVCGRDLTGRTYVRFQISAYAEKCAFYQCIAFGDTAELILGWAEKTAKDGRPGFGIGRRYLIEAEESRKAREERDDLVQYKVYRIKPVYDARSGERKAEEGKAGRHMRPKRRPEKEVLDLDKDPSPFEVEGGIL